MSIKIPYFQVAFEVEKLYQKKIDFSNTKTINEHCEFITDFIEACGYSIEEYCNLYWHDGNIL